jgi:predicted Holliday junction resolvase-like endonuclease
LLRAVELAQLKLQAAQRNFETNPDKDYFRRRVSEAEIKVKEAENKLHEVEAEIEEYLDKDARNEEEGNQLMGGLMEHFGADILAALIDEYGPPAHGQQGTPNDVFWGAALLNNREILFSPAHRDFYEYDP